MNILYFFEVARIARSGATSLSRPGFSYLPASDRTHVEAALDSWTVDAILVPARSVDCWFAVEDRIGVRITMPRILTVVSPERATLWTPQLAEESGFDGLLIHDRFSPASEFADQFARVVHSCTTAGARRPEKLSDLTRCPTIDEITLGDRLNAQILHLMSFGRTHEEVARGVERAPQTVRNRTSRMIQAAGVRNQTELTITYEQALVRQKSLMEIEARL